MKVNSFYTVIRMAAEGVKFMRRTTLYILLAVAGVVGVTLIGLNLLLSTAPAPDRLGDLPVSVPLFATLMVVTAALAVLAVLRLTRREIPQWDTADRLHDYRVALYTWRFAQSLGLDAQTCRHYAVGAFLHDVGTVMIPTAILVRKGPLTDEEFRLVRQHVRFGTALLEKIGLPAPVMEIPRYHHEHFDGSGYLEGLAGESIPLGARLFALVDVFDVLVTDRPYKSAMPLVKAKAVIREEAGRQFDPALCEHFLAHVNDWYAEIGTLDSTGLREKVRHTVDDLFELSAQLK